jgi:hypothetical protein
MQRRTCTETCCGCYDEVVCPARVLLPDPRAFSPISPFGSVGLPRPPSAVFFFSSQVIYCSVRTYARSVYCPPVVSFDDLRFSKLDGPQIRGSSETYSWARTLSYGRNRRIITIPGSFAVDVTPFAVRCSIKSRMMVRDLGYPSAPPLLDQCCAHLQCTLELSLRQPV